MTQLMDDSYRPIFDPPRVPPAPAPAAAGQEIVDRASPLAYVFDEPLLLAVNVALATGRPLLLRGRPGTGKSSVAASIAEHLGRRFYPLTVTSRTQARDLLWTVDDVDRLSDATTGNARPREEYVRPGPLWWAFSAESAARRGLPADRLGAASPAVDPNRGVPGAAESVVLLDEIDKADPDVPNDLLEPIGLYQFTTERGDVVRAATAPLVVITTNEERDLPRAFLRRCVVHALPLPTRRRLVEIAQARFGADGTDLYQDVVLALPATGPAAAGPAGAGRGAPAADPEQDPQDVQVDVSVAEFIDIVRAATKLEVRPGGARWPDVVAAATKPGGAGRR